MTRHAAILALWACAWSAGCGAPTVSDTPSTDTSPPEEPVLAYNAREGRTVFQYYCAPCHGEEGRGDGFNAYNLDPKPRDLADPDFQQTRTDDDLAAIVRTGGGVAGLSNSMPPWGRTLSERQIHNLVRFMRYLPTTEGSDYEISHSSAELPKTATAATENARM